MQGTLFNFPFIRHVIGSMKKKAMFVNEPTKLNKAYSSYYCKHTIPTVIELRAALCFIPCCGHINNYGQNNQETIRKNQESHQETLKKKKKKKT